MEVYCGFSYPHNRDSNAPNINIRGENKMGLFGRLGSFGRATGASPPSPSTIVHFIHPNTGGGFVYDRQEVSSVGVPIGSPVHFEHTNGGLEIDTISTLVKITRGYTRAIYNTVSESGYNGGVSPEDTEWNVSYSQIFGTASGILPIPWSLLDSTKDFVALGVKIGSRVVNTSAGGGWGVVSAFIDDHSLLIDSSPSNGGITPTNFSAGDSYEIDVHNGWDDLSDIATRSYQSFDDMTGIYDWLGQWLIGAELVMHLITDDRYFKVKFSDWVSGTKQGINMPADEISDAVHIQRGIVQGIYNEVTESQYTNDHSPEDTEWNWEFDAIGPGTATGGSTTTLEDSTVDFVAMGIKVGATLAKSVGGGAFATVSIVAAHTLTFSSLWPSGAFGLGDPYGIANSTGWDDLSDAKTTRVYTDFESALSSIGGVGIGNTIVGAELLMHLITDDRYFKVKFSSWKKQYGGGFVYDREEI